MRSGSLTSHRKEKNHGKAMEAKKIVDFFKPSQKTSSSNLSSDVAPYGFRHQHTVQSYVQPTALVIFEIGDKLSTKIRWI